MGASNHTDLPLPSFCPDCGEPYPWTEAKLKAAQELTDLNEDLSPEERETHQKLLLRQLGSRDLLLRLAQL